MTLPTGVRVAWRALPPGTSRRATSRALLAELLPGASFVSRCSSCGGDHGRVRVEGVDAAVSVSYAPGWAVVAVTRDHTSVGIDAVPAGTDGLGRVLTGAADAREWARVEAVVKADGRGLRLDPSRVTVRATTTGWVARISEQNGRDPGARTVAWHGWDLDAPAGIVAAVALHRERGGSA